VCCVRSPGRGSATTIPTRNRCSTPCRRSPAERLVSTGLPQPAVRRQGGGMRVGSGFCGLVQPPPPSQRHQVCNASPTSQRCRHRNLTGADPCLRESPPGPPKTLEPIHSLLAPTGSGVDQQATRRPPIQSGATIYPSCLKSSQGVTPFLKVTGSVVLVGQEC
jgi:hypothetical protein